MHCGSLICNREQGGCLDLDELKAICELPPNKKNNTANSSAAFIAPSSKDF